MWNLVAAAFFARAPRKAASPPSPKCHALKYPLSGKRCLMSFLIDFPSCSDYQDLALIYRSRGPGSGSRGGEISASAQCQNDPLQSLQGCEHGALASINPSRYACSPLFHVPEMLPAILRLEICDTQPSKTDASGSKTPGVVEEIALDQRQCRVTLAFRFLICTEPPVSMTA